MTEFAAKALRVPPKKAPPTTGMDEGAATQKNQGTYTMNRSTAAREFPRSTGHTAGAAALGHFDGLAPIESDDSGPPLFPVSDIEAALTTNPTETNLALAFAHRMEGKLLYCADLGGWLEWSGTHWKRDKLRRAYNYCVRLSRSLQSTAKSAGKASFAKGVETIASAEPMFARLVEDFDRDHDLIATPAGTVNLRTGVILKARPDDMITRCTTVSPEVGRPVKWLEFLCWAFDGDEDTIEYLREFIGYSLTGHVGAEIFIYLDGPGGNGKGCLSSVLRLIGGDYYHSAPASLLLYSSMPQHPTSVAALRGKRIVVASELPVGARLDEQRLKLITGGDPVRAHLMRQDELEFLPELKLFIAANHQPRIVRPDEAMRRRLRVISMPKTPEKPDPAFKSVTLPSEAGRIFTWAIEGAIRVLARGEKFITPQRILDDSERYLGSQDSLWQFMNDCCDRSPSISFGRTELYKAYQAWAAEAGETYTMPARDFYSEMEKAGFKPVTIHGQRSIKGIALKPKPY